jgi:ParB-like chromosome segregation protein Spo0J
MSSKSMSKLEGFESRGSDIPWFNPNSVVIVGCDESAPLTGENWYAYCPRASDPLEDEWIEDIAENGVRSPVDVYRDGDRIIVLEGRRRIRAARIVWERQQQAGVDEDQRIKVRANIRTGDASALFLYNVGSDNRKERSPLQRASLMLHAQKHGCDKHQIAKMFSCTTMTVDNMLSLFRLHSEIQRDVDRGAFPIREAIKLASLSREEQKSCYDELRSSGATSGAAAANGIEKKKKGIKVDGADKRRMLAKPLLLKWTERLRAVDLGPTADIIDFILGGPIPESLNEEEIACLTDAGYRPRNKKKAKSGARA